MSGPRPFHRSTGGISTRIVISRVIMRYGRTAYANPGRWTCCQSPMSSHVAAGPVIDPGKVSEVSHRGAPWPGPRSGSGPVGQSTHHQDAWWRRGSDGWRVRSPPARRPSRRPGGQRRTDPRPPIAPAWERRKPVRPGPDRRCEGSAPWRFRISQTVEGATAMPRPANSPAIRR
jgi:hypothetical protein